MNAIDYLQPYIRSSLQVDIKESGPINALQEAARTERRLNLRRKIERLRESQASHTPGLAQHLPEGALDIDGTLWQACEDLPLYLPSSLSHEIRLATCSPQLVNIEDQLRFAHLCEALDNLRTHLRSRVFANMFKIKNITGQRANTRARE